MRASACFSVFVHHLGPPRRPYLRVSSTLHTAQQPSRRASRASRANDAKGQPGPGATDNVRQLPVAATAVSVFELEGEALGAALYDRFGGDVNRVVRSVLGPDSEHDDLVQQVFATVLRNLDRLRDASSLRSWIVAIAANTTRSELRRRRRWRWLSLSSESEELPVPGVDHEGRDLLARFYDVVDKLPTDQRMVFVFRYVDERPLAEIASVCDCSVATVKRRLTRADERFVKLARKDPELSSRLHAGKTWARKL